MLCFIHTTQRRAHHRRLLLFTYLSLLITELTSRQVSSFPNWSAFLIKLILCLTREFPLFLWSSLPELAWYLLISICWAFWFSWRCLVNLDRFILDCSWVMSLLCLPGIHPLSKHCAVFLVNCFLNKKHFLKNARNIKTFYYTSKFLV